MALHLTTSASTNSKQTVTKEDVLKLNVGELNPKPLAVCLDPDERIFDVAREHLNNSQYNRLKNARVGGGEPQILFLEYLVLRDVAVTKLRICFSELQFSAAINILNNILESSHGNIKSTSQMQPKDIMKFSTCFRENTQLRGSVNWEDVAYKLGMSSMVPQFKLASKQGGEYSPTVKLISILKHQKETIGDLLQSLERINKTEDRRNEMNISIDKLESQIEEIRKCLENEISWENGDVETRDEETIGESSKRSDVTGALQTIATIERKDETNEDSGKQNGMLKGCLKRFDDLGMSYITELVLEKQNDKLKLLLLERPGIVKMRDDHFRTPFLCAAQGNNLEIMKILLGCGETFNIKEKLYGGTALHLAVYANNVDCIQWLVEKFPMLLSEKDYIGDTPLHYAAHYDYITSLKLLLNHGGDIHMKNDKGLTPLEYAKRRGNESCVQELQEWGLTSFVKKQTKHDPDKEVGDQDEMLKECLKRMKERGITYITELIVTKQNDKLKLLLRERPDIVKMSDYYSRTPFLCAAQENNLEIMKVLLEYGTSYDEKDGRYGGTALHLAVYGKHVDCVLWLLEKFPTLINEKDRIGDTPLHYAAYHDALASLKHLLHYDADIHMKNDEGCTPLEYAKRRGNAASIQELQKWLSKSGIK